RVAGSDTADRWLRGWHERRWRPYGSRYSASPKTPVAEGDAYGRHERGGGGCLRPAPVGRLVLDAVVEPVDGRRERRPAEEVTTGLVEVDQAGACEAQEGAAPDRTGRRGGNDGSDPEADGAVDAGQL